MMDGGCNPTLRRRNHRMPVSDECGVYDYRNYHTSLEQVTLLYGLCQLNFPAIAALNVLPVLRDVVIVFIPMLLILWLIIVSSEVALWLANRLLPATFQ